MISYYLNNNKKIFYNLNYFEKLFITFPFFAILGSFAINVFYVLMTILFFYSLHEKKNFKDYIKYIFFFFSAFIIIILSYIFSDYKNNLSLIRSISSIRFFLMIYIFFIFVKNKSFFKLLGQVSIILSLFLSFDIIFQYYFGFDFFGFKPFMENRYAGFLDEELVAGFYLSTFYLFSVIYIYSDNKLSRFFIFFSIVFFTIIITGERLALIKFIFLNFFIFVFLIRDLKKKIIFSSLILFLFFTSIMKLDSFKVRISELLFYLGSDYIVKIDPRYHKYNNDSVSNSPWVSHWIVAAKIFKDHPLTGVGIKNFRVVCANKKYDVANSLHSSSCTTHPHNLYMEIFSELGLIGFLVLIIYTSYFIKKVLSLKKNFREPAFILFIAHIIFILIPILPSGSIFSSYYGGILFFIISSTVAYLSMLEK